MATKTPSAGPSDIKRLIDIRRRFRAQILSDPHFLHDQSKRAFEGGVSLQGNTTFERLGCVGYQPQTERLEAVVYINEPSGYGGQLCTDGSQEFVRFYASWDDGGTWTDLGLSAFTVWDIPEGTEGRARLEYAATRRTDFRRRICLRPQIVIIRAILSWSVPPPANMPDWPPFWGNVHETNILVEPLRRWRIHDLFEVAKVQPAPELIEALDLDSSVAVQPKALSVEALQKLYKGSDVPPKRYALPQLHSLLSHGAITAGLPPGSPLSKQPFKLGPIDANLPDLVALLDPGDGNTTYEELECIGYDPEDDSMVGVVRVKRPTGFSGGPCTSGSREYVTFWADLNNNGTFETCLGTAEVRVYDIARFPRTGLEFAVHLPVNLIRYRIPCQKGPRLIPIRAILSWQVKIPCSSADKTPVWGNRLETVIHVAPGREVGDKAEPLLSSVGSIPVSKIDSAGLAQDAVAISTGAYFNQAPFGGRINLAGKIVNGNAGTRYRVMIRPQGGGAFLPLNLEPNGIPMTIVTPGPVITSTTQHAAPDGYYDYQDYSANHYVESNILAVWRTGAGEHGNVYELRVDIKDPFNPFVDIQSNVVTVEIDNEAPAVTLAFTLVGGDCAHFDENTVFNGTFSVTDPHFGAFSFEILPPGPAAGVLPSPASGRSLYLAGAIPDPGISTGFALDTAGMSPCGYALVLHASDRTNVNSGQGNNYNKDSVGFCLGSPPHPE